MISKIYVVEPSVFYFMIIELENFKYFMRETRVSIEENTIYLI